MKGTAKNQMKRTYKDTLFRMLFRDKENLLSLYNAVNGTDYTDTDNLEITTLENAVYMNYKNDISFIFHFELLLYEHQSTVNPNMPLRQLFYVSGVLQKRTRNDNIYGTSLIHLPLPKFAVFYNGATPQPEKQILRLSDSYEQKSEVIAVSIFEYDEEKHLKNEREYAYHQGEKAGLILAFLDVGYPKEKILQKLTEHYSLTQNEAEDCFEKTVKKTFLSKTIFISLHQQGTAKLTAPCYIHYLIF